MSERLEHEEDLPQVKLNYGDGQLELTPENSSLYLYLGRLACYSHVFIETTRSEDDKRLIGSYIFSTSSVFNELSQYMASRGYPLHANLREVPDCDVKAFDDMIAQQLSDLDTIPEGWGDDNTET